MKELEDCLREALEESPYGIVTNDTALETARKYASELLRQRDELKEALDRIADPIAYMERNLKEGERLDGMMAIHIANNPEYLKKIAEAAIKNTER